MEKARSTPDPGAGNSEKPNRPQTPELGAVRVTLRGWEENQNDIERSAI